MGCTGSKTTVEYKDPTVNRRISQVERGIMRQAACEVLDHRHQRHLSPTSSSTSTSSSIASRHLSPRVLLQSQSLYRKAHRKGQTSESFPEDATSSEDAQKY
mmetsp:Transcript_95106/g.168001  ORF Transcript_95106/g.168001 Transcript_95106/m.168001 type:complete len:102 (+) Transcript_95106:88-393(+)